MKKESIKKLIKSLNFSLLDGIGDWRKNYKDGTCITVSLQGDNPIDWRIDWGNIKSYRNTTSNFSQEETLVVFECVNRLLEKGYPGKNIELEKAWQLGHKGKGFLDIFIKDNEGKAYLMIECKTWGKEYDLEQKNMRLLTSSSEPKGQLFSYFSKERSTQYLCLYASKIDGEKIRYLNSIIPLDKDIFGICDNDREVFDAWNKQFDDNGIFEEGIKPYGVSIEGINEGSLWDMTAESGGIIFNGFAEILRRNVISDKTNAFNKIFNLFICKIVDEDEKFGLKHVEMGFQWKEGEKAIDVLMRISDLYKSGMKRYLGIDIKDHSSTETDKLIENFQGTTTEISKLREIIIELRLYKNNEFAFIEIFDEKSFMQNAKVVKEVVRLLQHYRIRYTHKHQFLGDFFEKLLNTGIKQESGQFFTPIPIARFICESLPFEAIAKRKMKEGDPKFLPYVIDYAAGSGHFLTEAMDRINTILGEMEESDMKGSTMLKNFRNYRESYGFANEFIYGIEKDYRLTKTSKVSCFLNGDGEARVICSDGLNSFSHSEYLGMLSCTSMNQDNPVFDCIVANPPYSVGGFKNTIPQSKEAFSLYKYLTDKSSEIECLFIERTKQLLKNEGVAGLVLPVSIFSNGGIYEKAREILLQNFSIKAIVECGRNTFMATGISTTIIFLERKPITEFENIVRYVDKFVSTKKDLTINGIENAISIYVHKKYHAQFDSYTKFISGEKNDEFSDILSDYREGWLASADYREWKKTKAFKALTEAEIIKEEHSKLVTFIQEIEKDKLIYFLLSYSQKTLIVKTGEKDDEKKFLGYYFSDRKGYEGIHYYGDGTEDGIRTSLYDTKNRENPLTVSYYITKMFKQGTAGVIDPSLENNIKEVDLSDIVTLEGKIISSKGLFSTMKKKRKDDRNSDKLMTLLWKKIAKVLNEHPYDLVSTKTLPIKIQKGTSITQAEVTAGDIPVVAGGQQPAYFHNVSNRDGKVITVSASGAYAGFVNYFDKPIFASDCSTIESLNETEMPIKCLYYVLKTMQDDIYDFAKGQAQGHVYPEDIEKLKVRKFHDPNKVLSEINKLETEINDVLKKLEEGL